MRAWTSLRTYSYVIGRARFMARCCSNSRGTRASSAAVLMSLSRAVVVPLDLLLSYRRTSSSHFSSPARRSCSLHRSGNKMYRRRALRFPPLGASQRRTNVSTLPDLMVPLQEQHRSSHRLSEVQHEPVRSLHLSDQTVFQVLRSW